MVYVDHDPVAVAASERLLKGDPHTRVLQADLRQLQEILESAQVRELIDLSQPVGVLMLAVLHFVTEAEDPDGIVAEVRDGVVPGSYLVVSHDSQEAELQGVADLYRSATDQVTYRTLDRIRDLISGWDLVEPGVVWVPRWRPDWPDEIGPDRISRANVAGVGCKPSVSNAGSRERRPRTATAVTCFGCSSVGDEHE